MASIFKETKNDMKTVKDIYIEAEIFKAKTFSTKEIMEAVLELYGRIMNLELPVKRQMKIWDLKSSRKK